MTEFTMLIGLVGSGKSTYANTLGKKVHSSDSLRKELWGDENTQGNNSIIFNTLEKRIKEDLKNGIDCVLDATNINSKKRRNFLKNIVNNIKDVKKKAVVVATSISVCHDNNFKRERVVPEDVITRMYLNFNFPIYSEGWDSIEIVYTEEELDYRYSTEGLMDKLNLLCDFNQNSKHHTLSLGDHCLECGDLFYRKTDSLAGYLHDIGKTETYSFDEVKQTAHYFGHQNVSAYEAMFFLKKSELFTDEEIVRDCQLIQMHMNHYLMTEERVNERAGELKEMLYLLYVCDMGAH